MLSKDDAIKTITTYTARIHKQMFGNGPNDCETFVSDFAVVIWIQGFVSHLESVLVNQGQMNTAASSRMMIMSQMVSELRGVIQLELDLTIHDFFSDWSYENNTGVIIATLQPPTASANQMRSGNFVSRLSHETIRLSTLTEKAPAEVTVFQVSPRVFLVMRKGILTLLERAMVANGFDKELRIAKADLEKTYFHRDGQFEDIFGSPVLDIFLDWNLHQDVSILCFIVRDKINLSAEDELNEEVDQFR